METAPTGFKAHVAAENAIKAQLPAAQAKQAMESAIEARKISPEMQILNSNAEIAIYGTKGRAAGFVDSETGQPLAQPIPGKIEEIRQNPRYGTKQADREARAQAYKNDVEGLVGEGFELTQTKLIMDKREERVDRVQKERGLLDKVMYQYRKNGMTEAESRQALKDRRLASRMIDWEKEDAELKETVRTKGIFTAEEYDAAGSEDPTTTEIPQVSPEGQNEADAEKLAALEDVTDKASEEFGRRSAGRARRTFHIKKEYCSNGVDGARMRYNLARDELLKFKSRLEEDKITRELENVPGVGAREIAEHMKWSKLDDALNEQKLLAETIYEERLLANGNGKLEDGKVVPVEPKTPLGRATGKFYALWAKLSGGKFDSLARANDLRDKLDEDIKKQEAGVEEARNEALSEGINLNINIPDIGGTVTKQTNEVIDKRRKPIKNLGKTALYGSAARGALKIFTGI